jgi:hypothetical protein
MATGVRSALDGRVDRVVMSRISVVFVVVVMVVERDSRHTQCIPCRRAARHVPNGRKRLARGTLACAGKGLADQDEGRCGVMGSPLLSSCGPFPERAVTHRQTRSLWFCCGELLVLLIANC